MEIRLIGKTVEGHDYYELRTDYGFVVFVVADKIYVHAIMSNKKNGLKEMINYIVEKFGKNRIVFWLPSYELIKKLKNIVNVEHDKMFGILVEIEWKKEDIKNKLI